VNFKDLSWDLQGFFAAIQRISLEKFGFLLGAGALRLNHVLLGLVPGIHAWKPSRTSKVIYSSAAWMAGTSPAMTRRWR
jgi:hypothetical protein